MSITRVLESSGGEIVFQLQVHDEPEFLARKERIKNLLEEKFSWARMYVEEMQRASVCNLDVRIKLEEAMKDIDAQLFELGIVNR